MRQQLPGGVSGGPRCHQASRVGLEGRDSLIGVQAAILSVVEAHQVGHHRQARFLSNRQCPEPRWGSGYDGLNSSITTTPTSLLHHGSGGSQSSALGLVTRAEGMVGPSEHSGRSSGEASTSAAQAQRATCMTLFMGNAQNRSIHRHRK